VKTGDLVVFGDLLGRVGNTGRTPAGPSTPSPNAITFGEIGAQRPFKNDYPANNALVTFK
jgi:hypothetical protein